MNEVDEKILELIDILKSEGTIVSDYQFAQKIDRPPQHINNVRNYDNRHFTLKDVHAICIVFGVNLYWIFGIENTVFKDEILH